MLGRGCQVLMFQKRAFPAFTFLVLREMMEPVELPCLCRGKQSPAQVQRQGGLRGQSSGHGFQTELHRLCCSPRQITPERTSCQTKSTQISVIPGGFAPPWLHGCPAVLCVMPRGADKRCYHSGLETFYMVDGTLYGWGKHYALAALLTEQGLNTYL